MFITVKAFKALINQAYKGSGLTIGRQEDRLLFCGAFWGIELKREVLPNKALAAVIELPEKYQPTAKEDMKECSLLEFLEGFNLKE